MNIGRILLLRQQVAATAAAVATRTTARHATTVVMRATPSGIGRRFLGAQAKPIVNNSSSIAVAQVTDAATACKYENLVQETMKKMIHNKDATAQGEDIIKSISPEEIEVRFNDYKKVFEEAELCLSDLRETLFEADDKQYREESNCAEGAVDNAFTAYVDLLEDLRRSTDEQLHSYSEIRNTNAGNLKRLRKELDSIIEVAENRNLAAS